MFCNRLRLLASPTVICLAAAILITSLCELQADEPARAVRRSDVVFMYDNPAVYEPYGCTVLGWAGSANADRIRQAHAAGVRHFSCSVGFLTEFRRVIDFDESFFVIHHAGASALTKLFYGFC